jgi:3-(3-hydroxy-phenyl)propionate hydroxylase
MEGTDDLLGMRMPDLDLEHGRVYELLRRARAVLLDLGGLPPLAAVVTGWADRVDLVRARPAKGSDLGADAVLIRPDGHVAWVTRAGEQPDLDALRAALTTWFGPAGLHGAQARHRPALTPMQNPD